MATIALLSPSGATLDARVDVEEGSIVVHSRSGGGPSARNRDYRQAVEAILVRLTGAGIKPDVYMDSNRVSHLPLAQRRLVTGDQLTGTIESQFDQIVRAMNASRPSNGAWSRIRLTVPPMPDTQLRAIVRGTLAPQKADLGRQQMQAEVLRRRLSADEQNRVRPEHVHSAVQRLLAGEDAPNFAPSRDYDLLTRGGERLAPKKVFGLALEEAGVVANAYPSNFSAGWGQPSFARLEEAGYSIIAKAQADAEAVRRRRRADAVTFQVDKEAATVGVDPEERSWIEGDVRMAKHLRIERRRSSKAVLAKRAQIRAANDGRLACEHCATDWYAIYPGTVAEAIFDVHHTRPLKDMDEGHETKVEELLCLCANCHRAEHRKLANEASIEAKDQ